MARGTGVSGRVVWIWVGTTFGAGTAVVVEWILLRNVVTPLLAATVVLAVVAGTFATRRTLVAGRDRMITVDEIRQR